MVTSQAVILIFCLYVGFLWCLAFWTEKFAHAGFSLVNNPLVYSLSLAVYCSSWTFLGSVGMAASRGHLFMTIYLGPTIMFVLWGGLLRKIIRIGNQWRITSIADFISTRYEKSDVLAASVTMVATVGNIPYVALQFKSILSTFDLITAGQEQPSGLVDTHVGVIVVGLMILFTIMFGVRKLEPTERHEGIVMAVAVESMVKIVAFLVVGFFVVYVLFNGFNDLFDRLAAEPMVNRKVCSGSRSYSLLTWFCYIGLSANAIMCLPRQFHIAVVENQSAKHLRWGLWLFPLYLVVISVFVHPIALAGLLRGAPMEQADTFVLLLPLQEGHRAITLLVFIGGFSAATSMIMICSMTMATMISNHLLLPLVDAVPRLNFIARRLLQARWLTVAAFISLGYVFERMVGHYYPLAEIGLMSFGAILQLAPSFFGGLFWRDGNRRGALLGLWFGFAVWAYTMLLPMLSRAGLADLSVLQEGPLHLRLLRPEALLGLEGLDPVAHAMIWSMIANLSGYIFGSLWSGSGPGNRNQAEAFVGAPAESPLLGGSGRATQYVPIHDKIRIINRLFGRYFSPEKTREMIATVLRDAKLANRRTASIAELSELYDQVEKALAGSIGSAMANRALQKADFFTELEAEELRRLFADILTSLQAKPADLKKTIDFYREREILVTGHARELEEKIRELEDQIIKTRAAEEKLKESEERYRVAIEGSSDGVVVIGGGRITWGNNRLPEMFGYESLDEILGRDLRLIIHPEDHDRVMKISKLRQYGEQAPSRYDFKGVRKDGTPIYVAVSATRIQFQGRPFNLAYLRDVTLRRMAEEEIHYLSRRLIESIEEERRRLAANLHDEFGQALTALHLGVGSIRSMTADRPDLEAPLNRITGIIEGLAETARNIAGELRPDVLDHLGLISAAEWHLNEFRQISGCRVEFDAVGFHSRRIQPQAEIVLYRVLQESLTNIVKHARASMVQVRLTYSHPRVILVISDDGQGFEPENGGPGRVDIKTGIGLISMKERVAAVGGTLDIRSVPGRGTTIRVTI